MFILYHKYFWNQSSHWVQKQTLLIPKIMSCPWLLALHFKFARCEETLWESQWAFLGRQDLPACGSNCSHLCPLSVLQTLLLLSHLCWGCKLWGKHFNPLTQYVQNDMVFLSRFFQERFKMCTCTSIALNYHSLTLIFISSILFENPRPFCLLFPPLYLM